MRILTKIAVADDPHTIRAKTIVYQLNRELGLVYQAADELGAGPLDEILRRVQLIAGNSALEKESEVAAVLGGEPHLKLKVSDLPDAIEAHHSTGFASMSPDQRKR